MTSRASPDSITIPARMRFLTLMRWWCTAAHISSEGTGALSLSVFLSERIIIWHPESMASSVSRHILSIDCSMTPAAGKVQSISVEVIPDPAADLIFMTSLSVSTGLMNLRSLQCSGDSSSRLRL